eukprot:UN20193
MFRKQERQSKIKLPTLNFEQVKDSVLTGFTVDGNHVTSSQPVTRPEITERCVLLVIDVQEPWVSSVRKDFPDFEKNLSQLMGIFEIAEANHTHSGSLL